MTKFIHWSNNSVTNGKFFNSRYIASTFKNKLKTFSQKGVGKVRVLTIKIGKDVHVAF